MGKRGPQPKLIVKSDGKGYCHHCGPGEKYKRENNPVVLIRGAPCRYCSGGVELCANHFKALVEQAIDKQSRTGISGFKDLLNQNWEDGEYEKNTSR